MVPDPPLAHSLLYRPVARAFSPLRNPNNSLTYAYVPTETPGAKQCFISSA